jgi:putative intracellular protease/amidase
MHIAIVLYPGLTALDAVGPYEVLRLLPEAEVRFVGAVPGSGPRTATKMADKQPTDWLRRARDPDDRVAASTARVPQAQELGLNGAA